MPGFEGYGQQDDSGTFHFYERDKQRLYREMVQDFDQTSFSAGSAQDVRGNAYDDTDNSYNLRASARGKPSAGNNILYDSPASVFNSRMLHDQFADFSMAGPNFDVNSSMVEVGRGDNNNNKTSKASSSKPTPLSAIKRQRRTNLNQQLNSPSPARMSLEKRLGERSLFNQDNTNTNGFTDNSIGMNTSTPKRPAAQASRKASSSLPKTTEQVSSAEKKKRNSTFQPYVNEDEGSSTLSETPERFNRSTTRRSNHESKKEAVPSGFKTTKQFIAELGLDTDTATVNLNEKPQVQARAVNIDPTTQSFLIPQMSDVSEVIGDVTKAFAARRRKEVGVAAHDKTPNHRPIESIPLPPDEKATLEAMMELRDKVRGLEDDNQALQLQNQDLQSIIRSLKQELALERKRVTHLETAYDSIAKLDAKKPTVGLSNVDFERVKIGHVAEKNRLETTISTLRTRVDELTHQLETTRASLRDGQRVREEAIRHAANLAAENEDLKSTDSALRNEIERLQRELFDRDNAFEEERQELVERYSKREEKLIQRLEATQAVAEQSQKELNDIRFVQQSKYSAEEEAQRITHEQIAEELRKIRPELAIDYKNKYLSAVTRESERVTEVRNNNFYSNIQQKPVVVERFAPPAPGPVPTVSAAPVETAPAAASAAPAVPPKVRQFVPDEVGNFTLTEDELFQLISNVRNLGKSAEKRLGEKVARREAEEKEVEAQKKREEEELRRKEEEEQKRRDAEEQARKQAEDEEAARKQAETDRVAREQAEAFAAFQRHMQNFLGKNPLGPSAPATQSAPQVETKDEVKETAQEVAVAAEASSSKDAGKKKRRIKKVVYYTEGDTTEISPEDLEGAEIEYRKRTSSGTSFRETAEASSSKSASNNPTFETEIGSTSRGTTVVDEEGEAAEGSSPSTEPAPMDRSTVQSALQTLNSHNSATCTYCQRHAGNTPPLPTTIHAILLRLLSSNSAHPAYTLPSTPENAELRNIIRQLQDEFEHVKMQYRVCQEEYLRGVKCGNGGGKGSKDGRREVSALLKEMEWRGEIILGLSKLAGMKAGEREVSA